MYGVNLQLSRGLIESYFVPDSITYTAKDISLLYIKNYRKHQTQFKRNNITEEQKVSSQVLKIKPESLRVLIVDDQPYNLYVLRELITLIDPLIKIEEALHGQEVIRKVMAAPYVYDIIFLDIQMPVLDGF